MAWEYEAQDGWVLHLRSCLGVAYMLQLIDDVLQLIDDVLQHDVLHICRNRYYTRTMKR